LKETDALFFGCREDGILAAATEITERDSELSINSLGVDPLYFRKGYASRLLSFVLDSFVWETAVVETAAANGPAIGLYAKFGFVEATRWQTADGISMVLLRTNHQRRA
jgi:ribosomal protein S18 acetylase RimI-like enzyme